MRSVRNNGFSSAQGHSANLTSQGYRKAHQQHRKLQFEPLEQRALLSVGDVTQISTHLGYYSSDWFAPQISDDGRYLAFTSGAGHDPTDTRGADVYVADRETDQITWVSRTDDGSQPDDGSWKPEISPDGRYVAFMSRADNLVPEDTDPSIDLFVYDRVTGNLECITADVDGDALSPRFSGDSQKIVYEFEIGDTVPSNPNAPTKDIILYDRTTGDRQVVSRGYDGQTCNGICWRPDISRDGGTVVFQSRSSNLEPNDNSASWDVYLYDVAADTLECISTDQYGIFGNGNSTDIHTSADGRFVTFQSTATNLDAPNSGNDNIFLLDRDTGQLQTIAGDGTPDGASATIRPGISNDGRYIVYNTTLPGYSETGSTNIADVYVYDRLTQTTQCVTVQSDGTPTGAVNAFVDISGNGHSVVFLSDATTLTDGPAPSSMDVFAMPIPEFPDLDFGDAPAPYPTLLADSGASHLAVGPTLGSGRDSEADGQPDTAAMGDDNDTVSDDEDGLNDPIGDLTLTIGSQPTVNVIVTNTTGNAATLSGWIDYDGDGVFDNATERAQATVVDGTSSGIVTLTFPRILTGYTGVTYARFRLSTDAAAADPIGSAWDGEVEDYLATITGPAIGIPTRSTTIGRNTGGGPLLSRSDFFGSSVATLGDVDGDGVTDLAVGVPGDDTGQTNLGNNLGAVYVLMMNADGTARTSQKIATGIGGGPTLIGGENYGFSVAALGDVDRDGIPDMAVGAPEDDTGGENRGAVYIHLLNSNGTVKASQKIASDTLGGPTLIDWSRFGGSITSLGDLDRDGTTDLAAGAYGDSSEGYARGAVHVLFMNPDGTVRNSRRIASDINGGPTLSDQDGFGRSVSSLGDMDGDGIPELAVGTPYDATGGDYTGAVYVLFMNADGAARTYQKIASGIANLETLTVGSRFGTSVSSLADLDGDGVTDLVVGAPDDTSAGLQYGALHLLLLNSNGTIKNSQTITSRTGHAPILELGDDFGWSVTSLGDHDRNGAIELAVGARTADIGGVSNSGAVYVLSLANAFDYGDAPSPYPTTLAEDGARHYNAGPTLGTSRDGEPGGLPNVWADGDDSLGATNDEDGVATPPLLGPGIRGTVLEVFASEPSFLNAWIDFDTDGIWEAAERIAVDQPLSAGVNQVTFDVPQSVEPGFTYARIRLTSYDNDGHMLPYGLADDGEVEDYYWAVENAIYIYGDPAMDDVVSIWPNSSAGHEVDLNGSLTTYDPAIYRQIHVDTLGGNDRVTVYGNDEDETVTMTPGSLGVVGESCQIHISSVETMTVDAGTGSDQVTMLGSAGSNRLYSYADSARMSDSPVTYSYRVDGFDDVSVSGPSGGGNYAFLYDSAQDDDLDADPTQVVFDRAVGTADATTTTITGFQRVYSYATGGGTDDVVLDGSAIAANRFYSYPDYSILTDSTRAFYFYSRGFDTVTGNSTAAVTTTAYLYDSADDDTFEADTASASMDRADPWSDVEAYGFSRIYAYSTHGGADSAALIGSTAGGNQYRGYPTYSTMTDAARSFYHYASSFRSVTAVGSQGDTSGDCAYLYDSSGDDTFDEAFFENGKYQGGSLTDAAAGTPGTYENLVKYFDLVYARSTDRDTDDTIAVEDEELLAYRLLRLGTW